MSLALFATAIAAVAASVSAKECVPAVDAATKAGLTDLIDFVTEVANDLPYDKSIQEIFPELFMEVPLEKGKRFTLFAPKNKAFEDIASVASTLPADSKLFVLLNHLVSGELKASDVVALVDTAEGNRITVPSLTGASLDVFTNDNGLFITPEASDIESKIVEVDIETCAGTIHVIDAVLVPSALPHPAVPDGGAYGDDDMLVSPKMASKMGLGEGGKGTPAAEEADSHDEEKAEQAEKAGSASGTAPEADSSAASSGGVSGATVGFIAGGAVAAVLAGVAAGVVYKKRAASSAAPASSAALSI